MNNQVSPLRFLAALILTGALSLVAGARAAVEQDHAVVTRLNGTAAYSDARGVTHPVSVGTVLPVGVTVNTAAASTVDLRLTEHGTVVGLNPGSTLTLTQMDYEQSPAGVTTQTCLELQAGELVGALNKLGAGSRFQIRTANAVADVKGAEFCIDAQARQTLVLQGTVVLNLTAGLARGTATPPGVTIGAGCSLLLPAALTEADIQSLESRPATSTAMARLLDRLPASPERDIRTVSGTLYAATGTASQSTSTPKKPDLDCISPK